MSHRDTLNDLTENAAERETWEEAVTYVHQALQIVGVVLDELEQRVSALEGAREAEKRS
jgi:hypothetical protein